MNHFWYRHNFNTDASDDPYRLDCTFLAAYNMLPSAMSNNSSPAPNNTEPSEAKIVPQENNRSVAHDNWQIETTADGDVMVVQPSFDDVSRSKTPPGFAQKSSEWQSRSPDGDLKQADSEERNPSSPPMQKPRGHARSLSGRFLQSATISDHTPSAEQATHHEDEISGRKHRRMFSGDTTNPNNAHRRINSIGQTASVSRRHHREDSGGLDILSAVAHSTKEELAAAGAVSETIKEDTVAPVPWDSSRRSQSYPPTQMRSEPVPPPPPPPSFDGMPRGYGHPHQPTPPMAHNQMHPPPHRRMPYPPHPAPGSYPQPYYPQYPHHSALSGSHYYPPPPPPPPPAHHHPAYTPSGRYMHPPYPPTPEELPPPRMARSGVPHEAEKAGYPTNPSSMPSEWPASGSPASTHQGSQTFVTAIAVGEGNKTIPVAAYSKSGVISEDVANNKPPMEITHHRKMSSFSSLGAMLGPNIFASTSSSRGTPSKEDDVSKGHHRKASSNISFLHGIDVGLEVDATFLRNLHASNEAPPLAPPPSEIKQDPKQPTVVGSAPSPTSDGSGTGKGTKLAPGGTSKRVRRKCTVEGCTNRVVQGGLCISHGAKRKTCKHPGCTKNVKKAGLCSTHGPARKRCEHPGCPKVAVQGGRCISHGAKKKLCSVPECTKQAILSGMCKKHHDQSLSSDQRYCRPANQAGHTRGLSFFQEITPDAISTLLNNSDGKSEQDGRSMW